MPSIAVLIGVSTYKSEAHLPACSHDVENLRQLLAATKKYDEIVSLTERTDASQLKDDLRAFFMRHQTGGPIEEAFVYFSGHGTYQNDAMFCCSDFDASRPATTSISNAELDDLLRSVEPEIAVKVIDACQSGSPYIKDAGASFEKALSSSKLRSFLCMTSSRQDQSSYATAAESDFTSCWISAALSKSDGSVFYRDIQAYLADSFSSHPDQTPYFVNQGTSLEVFSAVTDEMRSLRSARQKIPSVAKANTDVITAIERVIAKEDARFVALADASKAIEKCKASLLAYQVSDHIVQAFYSCAVSLEPKLDALPRAAAIAQFAV